VRRRGSAAGPALRSGSPAVLGLAARRRTHCASCARSVRTASTSQFTMRACGARPRVLCSSAAHSRPDAAPPSGPDTAGAMPPDRTPRALPRGRRYPVGAISGATRSAGPGSARRRRASWT